MDVLELIEDEYPLSDVFFIENDLQLVYVPNIGNPYYAPATVISHIYDIDDKNYRLPIIELIRQI